MSKLCTNENALGCARYMFNDIANFYAKKNIQDDIDPLVISWGYDAEIPGISKFLDYHQNFYFQLFLR